MSLILDFADYIEANSSLVLDTNLFVGEPIGSPDSCVIVLGSSGIDEESGLERRGLQILAKDKSYESALTLADTVYDLLKNKPGFDSISDIFYCQVINSPY